MSHDPPPGPPWDVPFAEASLVFLDLEMTGLDRRRDRIIEVCAERVRAGSAEGRIATLLRPECGTFGNAHVHGIRADELEGAPVFSEVVGPLRELLDGAVPVAHGASWDVAFLEAECERAGVPAVIGPCLDTLALSRRALHADSHALGALAALVGAPQARAHRAADDVKALERVFERLVELLAPATPRDLWHVQPGTRRARPDIVAAAERARESGAPVSLRYRRAKRGIEELFFVVTEVQAFLDPPVVLGYLLPSRGRRELRADRILAIEAARSEPGSAPRSPP